jgi:hypothetical protein
MGIDIEHRSWCSFLQGVGAQKNMRLAGEVDTIEDFTIYHYIGDKVVCLWNFVRL